MLKPNWLLDDYILEQRDSVGYDLLGAITASGSKYHIAKYIPFAEARDQDYGPIEFRHQPTIMYGQIGWVKKCPYSFTPGAWGSTSNLNCDQYYTNVPNEWLLNSDYIMLPYYKLCASMQRLCEIFESDSLFIRPVKGSKTFTGQVITLENYMFELNASTQITAVMPDTLVLIAAAKPIQGEFRFVIAANEVIGGSEYRWNNKLDVRIDYPNEALVLAKMMSRHEWQPDTVYTCDVAMVGGEPYIIELNGFASAGLYACDRQVIVDRLNEVAMKEYYA